MFARRLGRLAGLVFVLAVVFGGVGAASVDSGEQGGSVSASAAVQMQAINIDWE